MKYNLKKVNLYNKPSMFGKWWKWSERCDRCGNVVGRGEVLSNKEPDFSEIDLCYDCIRFFMRNNIRYNDVNEYIKREKNNNDIV